METIAISRFKAECLAVLERVRRTGEPVLVTRFGKPVAEIVPATTPSRQPSWVGRWAATGKVFGDIVAPGVEPTEWETLTRILPTGSSSRPHWLAATPSSPRTSA